METETIHKIGAIVIKDGTFLVVRKKGKDTWISLGGKPEPMETEEEALTRETREELNCGIHIIKKLLDVEGRAIFEDAKVKLSFYLAELEGDPKVAHELEEFAYISSDYKSKGIKLPASLEDTVIPFCIKSGYLKW